MAEDSPRATRIVHVALEHPFECCGTSNNSEEPGEPLVDAIVSDLWIFPAEERRI